MKVCVIGLGLIGGSIAKALSLSGKHEVYGKDIVQSVELKAKLLGAISAPMTIEHLKTAEVIILALYPRQTIKWVKENVANIAQKTIVIDSCGTKRLVMSELEPFAAYHGFYFFGGHPMAGKEYSGFDYASGGLFAEASMLIVPPRFQNYSIEILAKVKSLYLDMGFGRIEITTAEKHDKIIAYTSQLAHIVSSSYVMSETAREHDGFSAGSYNDMTRVSQLNPVMWRELMMDNRESLMREIEGIMTRLAQFKLALDHGDDDQLLTLLTEGTERKREVK